MSSNYSVVAVLPMMARAKMIWLHSALQKRQPKSRPRRKRRASVLNRRLVEERRRNKSAVVKKKSSSASLKRKLSVSVRKKRSRLAWRR